MVFLAVLDYALVWAFVRYSPGNRIHAVPLFMEIAMAVSLLLVTVFLAVDSWMESAGYREGREPVTLVEIIAVALWPKTNWNYTRRRQHHSESRPKTLNRLVLAVYGAWLLAAFFANVVYLSSLHR